MDATNYLRDAIINFWLRNDPDSITAPASVWFGLTTTTAAADGTGTEPSGASYVRVQMSWSDPAGSGDASENQALAIPFATGESDTTVVGCGVWDSSTGGNMLLFDNFTSSFTVTAGNTLSFAAGDVDLQVR